MKYKLNSKSETNFGAHVVEGTTLTIPGLAPSLIELLEANLAGEGLPMVGKPLFDDSEEAGSARLAAKEYSNLGYNTDYKSGYNLSAAPDTSRQRYQELQGKKATAGMSDRELNLYFAWKEQQGEVAIGQNPFYTEGIGNDANLSSFNNPEAPAYNSEQGSMMNVINSVLQGTMQIASFANNLQSSEVDRELVRQKAISQGLENSKQMYLLGFGYDYNMAK
ncbi:unnamed protein product [Cylicocyclus nassatus]|uniref:Uncharacterized protein n=1 Tax=Cylicocyclus nassatus TaxID=53992 RepID=A0AA36DR48_CYLNA|nr:unnamed protein product [Cylicocyclus nassatus]